MKLSLQFHADPDELLSWASTWARDERLAVACEWFNPQHRVETCTVRRPDGLIVIPDGIRRLVLGLGPLDLNAVSAHDLVGRNPDALVVYLGERSASGLRESWLAAHTDSEPSLRAWKRIRNKAKAALRRGPVVVVNPVTGASGTHQHYYSPGAQELAGAGVRMLAAAGWNEYRFPT